MNAKKTKRVEVRLSPQWCVRLAKITESLECSRQQFLENLIKREIIRLEKLSQSSDKDP